MLGVLGLCSGLNFEVFRNDADRDSLRIEWSFLWFVRGGDRERFIHVLGFLFFDCFEMRSGLELTVCARVGKTVK